MIARRLLPPSALAALAIVVIRTSSGSQLQPAGPMLKITQVVRIDAGQQNLVPIGSIHVGRDGSIVVSQPMDRAVLFFSATGALLGKFGRAGQGPGELSTVTRIGWAADTLWMYDLPQRRVNFVSPQRTLIRSAVIPSVHPAPADAARYPVLPILDLIGIFPGGDILAGARVGAGVVSYPPGYDRTRTPLFRLAPDGTIKQQIAWIPKDEGMLSVALPSGAASVVVPFTARPGWVTSGDGSRIVMITSTVDRSQKSGTLHIVMLATTGDTIYVRDLPVAGVPVPARAADSARAVWRPAATLPDPLIAALSKAIADYGPLPPIYPLLAGATQISRDGSLWMRIRIPGDGRQYIVLDARGNPYGQALLPANVMLFAPSLTDFWGTEQDADDLQNIVHYRVELPR